MMRKFFEYFFMYVGAVIMAYSFASTIRRDLIEYWNHKEINKFAIPAVNKYVKNLNSGGCGFFAMKLYGRLDSSEYDIVKVGGWKHVALLERKTGFFIDANGYRDSLSFQLRYGNNFQIISIDTLKSKVYDLGSWNTTFNKADTTAINIFIDLIFQLQR